MVDLVNEYSAKILNSITNVYTKLISPNALFIVVNLPKFAPTKISHYVVNVQKYRKFKFPFYSDILYFLMEENNIYTSLINIEPL